MRNAIIKNFKSLNDRNDKGALFENFIFRELIEYDLKYYRSKSGAEVNFIVNDEIPIEVKSIVNSTTLSKSFSSFIQKYNIKNGFVANIDFLNYTLKDKTKVQFVPHALLNSFIQNISEKNAF